MRKTLSFQREVSGSLLFEDGLLRRAGLLQELFVGGQFGLGALEDDLGGDAGEGFRADLLQRGAVEDDRFQLIAVSEGAGLDLLDLFADEVTLPLPVIFRVPLLSRVHFAFVPHFPDGSGSGVGVAGGGVEPGL